MEDARRVGTGCPVVVSTQQVFVGSQLGFCTLSSETLREDADGPTGSFLSPGRSSAPGCWRGARLEGWAGAPPTSALCLSSTFCMQVLSTESQADTAPAPRRPTCRRDRARGGGLRAHVRPGGGVAEERARGWAVRVWAGAIQVGIWTRVEAVEL